VACGLALLASGQAIAAGTCTSVATGSWSSFGNWADGTAGGASCDGSSVIPAAADNAIINSNVTVSAPVAITNLTVNAARVLVLFDTLTVSGTATINGGINYVSGILPSAITSIGQAFTTGAAYILPATVTSLGSLSVNVGALTLSAANVVMGAVTIDNGGSIAGVLKLAPTGDHTITALAAGSTIPSLDLSGATGNKTITSSSGSLAFGAVTFPTTASKVITFAAGVSAPISVPVPAANVATCVLGSGSVTAPASSTISFPTGTLVCTSVGSTPVNAPIDLKMNKEVETFATEIELK